MSKRKLTFIDLFAGAGGLSEGFIRAGYEPIAHVEMDTAACYTLKTRAAYHWLKANDKESIYISYLKGEIKRKALYDSVPQNLLDSIINLSIGEKNNKKIQKTIDKQIGKNDVDLIIGGPPCQAYSYIGRAALKHKNEDERTTLYIHYGRFLKKYNPKVFIFENVPGLLTAGDGKYYRNLQKYYKKLGYTVEAQLHDAFDYGVIQNRKRLIIIGWKKNLNFSYPILKKTQTKYNRDDIFSDLPLARPNETRRYQQYRKDANEYLLTSEIRNGIDFVTQHVTRPHNQNDLKIYRLAIEKLKQGERLKNNQIPESDRTQKNVTDFLDRFKVVSKVPHTMIAHIAKDGHHFIHPDENQLRSISVREAARIQSFPDNYHFEGIKEGQFRTAAFRQIGNAVPPVLAEKIAIHIKKMFK